MFRTVGTTVNALNVVNRHFKPPKYAQHLAEHASIQLTLESYSHWMPSMGRNTASTIDAALGPDEATG